MAISCRIVFPDNTYEVLDFDNVPRTGDFVVIPNPERQPVRFRVGQVFIAATGMFSESVAIQVGGTALPDNNLMANATPRKNP